MNCFESYLVELLQGHIIFGDKVVEVRKQFSNNPGLPIITLDLSGGVTTDYFYHDTEGKTEKVFQRCTSHININVWCNTEDERESITEQIRQCYLDEVQFHCRYCSQFSNGTCGFTGTDCEALTTGIRGKYHCPNSEEYGYQSLHEQYNLVEDTLRIESPFDMDEYDKHPPILRSVLRASCDYEEEVRNFGHPYKGTS